MYTFAIVLWSVLIYKAYVSREYATNQPMGDWRATFFATRTQTLVLAVLRVTFASATCIVSQRQIGRTMWAPALIKLGLVPHARST